MSTERTNDAAHHDRYWRISVWIDKALEEPVRAYARSRGVSVNALITRLLTAELGESGALSDDAREATVVDDWMSAGMPIRAAKALARAGVTRELAGRLSNADLRALPSVGEWAVDEARRIVPAPPSPLDPPAGDPPVAAATDNGHAAFDPGAVAPHREAAAV